MNAAHALEHGRAWRRHEAVVGVALSVVLAASSAPPQPVVRDSTETRKPFLRAPACAPRTFRVNRAGPPRYGLLTPRELFTARREDDDASGGRSLGLVPIRETLPTSGTRVRGVWSRQPPRGVVPSESERCASDVRKPKGVAISRFHSARYAFSTRSSVSSLQAAAVHARAYELRIVRNPAGRRERAQYRRHFTAETRVGLCHR